MSVLFNQQRYELLHIVHCPAGKYYTLYTPDELKAKANSSPTAELRIVCTLTPKELRIFSENNQPDLFPDSKRDSSIGGEN